MTEQGKDPRSGSVAARGRAYTVLGVLVILGLVVVTALGVAGVASPSLLSVRSAFFVVGASIAVLAVAVVVLLFSLHKTMQLLRETKERIDREQDERLKLKGELQRARDHDQDAAFEAFVEAQTERDRAQDARVERFFQEQQARVEAMVAKAEADFEAIVSHQEGRIAELRRELTVAPAVAATTDATPRAPEPTPFGDIHPVIDVEGIGEVYEERLQALNILDTEQLWEADASIVARELDVPETTVRGWQSMAELMALDRIGPQYAEVLVRAGVDGIDALARADPAELAVRVQRVEAERDVRVQGNKITEKIASSWVSIAQEHDPRAQRVRR